MVRGDIPNKTERKTKMKKYRVCYKSKTDGDTCKVWCNAVSEADAKAQVRREYWDVAEIIYVERM
jgi:hypothetical protein